MLVLGLDTSLQCCSVAILKDGAVIADQSIGMERGHAEHLAPMAAAALAEAALAVRDLDRIGVVVGPGGFAGVRVGLSFARGMAIGMDLDVIGVTSLAALACNLENIEPGALIAPVIDARRGQLYAGLYEHCGATLVEPFVATPGQVSDILIRGAAARPVSLVGSGASQIDGGDGRLIAASASTQIDSKHVARIAAAAQSPEGMPAPLYLRAPDAKPPKPNRFQGFSVK